MALRLAEMLKFFTPPYATSWTVKRKYFFVSVTPEGQLVPIGQARSYVDKKDEDGAKPILELDDFGETPSREHPRSETIEGKTMEKQEELKKKSNPKPDATDS